MKIPAFATFCLLATLSLTVGCDNGDPAESSPTQSRRQAVRPPKTPNLTEPKAAAPKIEMAQEGAQIKFDQEVKDFGRVPDTVDLSHGFTFTNIGTSTLIIQDVKPSCGCTTTALDRTTYAPGESGVIDIVWEPKGHGKQSKTITIRSNSKRTPIVQLRIAAEIEPFLKVEPSRAEFNLVKRGQCPDLILTVSCDDPELEIIEVKGTTPDLDVSLVAPAENGQAQVRVKITEKRVTQGVRRFFPKVLITGRARVNGVGIPVEHTHSVPVIATLYDQLAPEPAFFGLGRVVPGRRITKEIILTRPSGEPFTITGHSMSNAMPTTGMTVQVEPTTTAAGQAYKITLTCAPGAYEGPLRGKVILETDIPSEKTLELDLFGVAGVAKPK